mmetsp:Transcript_74675/g.211245  ORF Transcript_74675/g.211245 Transcript_74675/m.211245 type:complete len:361 (+) Transcript_74675:92-1174(+)
MAAVVIGGADDPWRISMVPAAPPLPPVPEQCRAPRSQGVSSGWLDTFVQVIPYLNPEQLLEMTAILNRAVVSSQQAKLLENIILSADLAGTLDGPNLHMLSTVAQSLVQLVCQQQQTLLGELSHLVAAASSPAPVSAPAGVAVTLPPPGLHTEADQRLLLNAYMHEGRPHDPWPAQAAAAPRPERQSRPPVMEPSRALARPPKTLSSSLQLLAEEDPAVLFIVRRIHKLGFKAARKLREYFAHFGVVVRVLVAHSTARGDARGAEGLARTRRRPSSLGFVQMGAAEAVLRILAVGAEQEVEGFSIRVQRFERQQGVDAIAQEEEAAELRASKHEDRIQHHLLYPGGSTSGSTEGSEEYYE